MVPKIYTGYFTAAASAAAALIGLLFVAISLRSDSVFGEDAPAGGRALAGSAFTGLVNAFFIALVAVIPGANLGITAALMAVLSGYSTVQLHRKLTRDEAHLGLLTLSSIAYLGQLALGIALSLQPRDQSLVGAICYITVASFVVTLLRAWALLQGKHVALAAKAHDATTP